MECRVDASTVRENQEIRSRADKKKRAPYLSCATELHRTYQYDQTIFEAVKFAFQWRSRSTQ